jgi:hypothetical protein
MVGQVGIRVDHDAGAHLEPAGAQPAAQRIVELEALARLQGRHAEFLRVAPAFSAALSPAD